MAHAPAPYPVMVQWAIFAPLGGFFNILVYTRPKVSTLRRRRPEYWWFQAFWMVVKVGGEVPDLPRRQQTNSLASGNHTDISAMRRRSVAAPVQPANGGTRDEVINEASEPLNSAKLPDRGARFDAERDVLEQLELALVPSEEEEKNNGDEGPATDESLIQQETTGTNEKLLDADNLGQQLSSCEIADTNIP